VEGRRQALRESRQPKEKKERKKRKEAGQAVYDRELQWRSSEARKSDSGSAKFSEEGGEKRLDGEGGGAGASFAEEQPPQKEQGKQFRSGL
jgi:hypothetical protein